MIVTVTANTSLDQVVFVPEFRLNQTIRASQALECIGGKPTDAAWVLGEMGLPSLALGFAAGMNGQRVEAILQAKGVTTDFISVRGESRRNLVIIAEDGSGQTTITATTLEVDERHIAALRTRYETVLKTASCIVLGGTLPSGMLPDFYVDLIEMARAHNVPTIFDASEPYLSAGLGAAPTYIKPNRDELAALTGHTIETVDDAHRAGREIFERYGTASIISLGAEGGLAVLAEKTYRIPPLQVAVVNTAGAGDAILAGLAASIERGQPIEDGLRLGFGAATAVVAMPGTAECRRADVEHYATQIELIPL